MQSRSSRKGKSGLDRKASRTRKPKRYSKLALHTSESRRRIPGLLLPNCWAPLIAAYTGCRISEALQLRKEDVRKDSGHYIFDLNPLAGSIKSGAFRLVPVHPHLIDLGLLRFVEQSDSGPLFAKGSYKRVLDFVRTIVTDERVQPNHAWRHRFKTISRNLGIDHRVVDAIQGHAARTSGEDYGNVSVLAMARVIDAIPRPNLKEPLTGSDQGSLEDEVA
jgi:integrase